MFDWVLNTSLNRLLFNTFIYDFEHPFVYMGYYANETLYKNKKMLENCEKYVQSE